MKQDSISTIKHAQRLRNQGGQAVIEYVLLLIVTVSMISFASNFFNSISNFMNSYLGDYVACLMEYGELPALHVSDADLKSHTGASGGGRVCAAKFSYTPQNGFGKTGSSQTSNSTNSGSRRNSSDIANKESSDSSSAKNQSKSSRSGGGSSGGTSASASSSRPGVNDNNGFGTADGPSFHASSKVKVIDEDEASAEKRNRDFNNGNSSRNAYNRNNYHGVTGRMAEEIEKSIKKSSRIPSSKTVAAAEDGYRMKLYKKTFNPPDFKPTSAEEKSEPFSFGYLIKWLLIIGMLLAILVLLGGQLLNYSNSKDQ